MCEAASLLDSEIGFAASMRSFHKNQFVIPLHSPENRKQWAYLDSALRTMRRVWAINIEHNRTYYCFLDFEMRKKGERAAALVKLETGARIFDPFFQMILHGLSSSEGDWSNNFFTNNDLIAFKCSHTWSDAKQFTYTMKRSVMEIGMHYSDEALFELDSIK